MEIDNNDIIIIIIVLCTSATIIFVAEGSNERYEMGLSDGYNLHNEDDYKLAMIGELENPSYSHGYVNGYEKWVTYGIGDENNIDK